MINQLEYLKWRGDLSFSKDKLNEVDGSILAMLSYIDYDSISKEPIRLSDAAASYCPDNRYDSVKLGLIIPSKKINQIFCLSGESARFSDVVISDFEWRTSIEECCQFAAVTYHLPSGRAAIAYRGTDDSLVGWREDCCLSYLDEIPAQRCAVEYFERMAEKYPNEKFYLVGHSKGGNLAVYAAVKCKDELKCRIVRVYAYDGPGFSKEFTRSKDFSAVSRKLCIIVPQSSFIGTMFDMKGKYTVVNGTARGPYQHDCFTWAVEQNAFARLPELSERGKRNALQFNQSMERMTKEEKREFADTLFEAIESTGAKSLTDFSSGTIKKLVTLIKNYSGMDKEKRTLMVSLLLKLFDFKKT
ncbi:MAG: DUF2974 domain-containing protein [Clostridia bacterium]|nr:DUF2974 domain-containing protein [Clostridia bacterium]